MQWLKRMLCTHGPWTWVRNLHGDEINQHNGCRSEWSCDQCGKLKYCISLGYHEK